jgi:hypothetical protein
VNQPAGQADQSPYTEDVSRFIVQSRWVRQDRSIRHTAFMPNPKTDSLATSVTIIGGLTSRAIWQIAQGVATIMGKDLHGRSDIAAEAVSAASLHLSITPTPENPQHADITGWPDDKPGQLLRAQKLAAKASRLIPADL